jgi:hypothetical protein
MAFFCCPRAATTGSRAALSLSPRSVPNVRDRASDWLEQWDRRTGSTSVTRRCSRVITRHVAPAGNDRRQPRARPDDSGRQDRQVRGPVRRLAPRYVKSTRQIREMAEQLACGLDDRGSTDEARTDRSAPEHAQPLSALCTRSSAAFSSPRHPIPSTHS